MPYPSQISAEVVLETAIAMLELDDAEALSLGKLAKALGVKTPSLYRYYDGKAALLRAVNLRTLEQLFAAFNAAMEAAPDDPVEHLLAVAQTLRTFALSHPHLYGAAMTAQVGVTRPDEDLLVQMILPLQATITRLTGNETSLTALRGLLALIHGFVMLEIHEQLQRGGNLDADYAGAVRVYLGGCAYLRP